MDTSLTRSTVANVFAACEPLPIHWIPMDETVPCVGGAPQIEMRCNFTDIVCATTVVLVTVHVVPGMLKSCASDIVPAKSDAGTA